MPEQIDASTLNDPTRVRRGVLAERHLAAQRAGDADELAKVVGEIEAEYADDPKPEPGAQSKAEPKLRGK